MVRGAGEQEAHRESRHRSAGLMYVADGVVKVEAEGRVHHLGCGNSLLLSGGVRHRRRTAGPGTRVLVVAVGGHVEVLGA
ncbi:AraC family ligand binding domain-containing protein [Streptomyces sp. NPDC001728]|uniref:AraC family ligand binding domain-containing protein n=1 Tax=Streptomyces sp. NPDC001728 TaxID=3154396 RepID=UPI003327C8EE